MTSSRRSELRMPTRSSTAPACRAGHGLIREPATMPDNPPETGLAEAAASAAGGQRRSACGPHSEGSAGPAKVQAIVELRPALRSRQLREAVAGLPADGRTTPRGAPRNLTSSAPPSDTPATRVASPRRPSPCRPHAPVAVRGRRGPRRAPVLEPTAARSGAPAAAG